MRRFLMVLTALAICACFASCAGGGEVRLTKEEWEALQTGTATASVSMYTVPSEPSCQTPATQSKNSENAKTDKTEKKRTTSKPGKTSSTKTSTKRTTTKKATTTVTKAPTTSKSKVVLTEEMRKEIEEAVSLKYSTQLLDEKEKHQNNLEKIEEEREKLEDEFEKEYSELLSQYDDIDWIVSVMAPKWTDITKTIDKKKAEEDARHQERMAILTQKMEADIQKEIAKYEQ